MDTMAGNNKVTAMDIINIIDTDDVTAFNDLLINNKIKEILFHHHKRLVCKNKINLLIILLDYYKNHNNLNKLSHFYNYCCYYANLEIFQLLIDYGVPPKDTFHNCLLELCSRDEVINDEKILVWLKIFLNHFDEFNADKILGILAENELFECMKYMMELGFYADKCGGYYHVMRTAIHIDSIKMVKFLLDNGADPMAHSGELVYHAFSLRRWTIVKLLYEYGANIKPFLDADHDTKNSVEYENIKSCMAIFQSNGLTNDDLIILLAKMSHNNLTNE